jgi:hypothetical protein
MMIVNWLNTIDTSNYSAEVVSDKVESVIDSHAPEKDDAKDAPKHAANQEDTPEAGKSDISSEAPTSDGNSHKRKAR